MNFHNNYNNNLEPIYNNREADFEIFFLNLIRYLKYFKILDNLFKIISNCEKGDDIFRYFNSEISTTDFSRLN